MLEGDDRQERSLHLTSLKKRMTTPKCSATATTTPKPKKKKPTKAELLQDIKDVTARLRKLKMKVDELDED